MSREGQPPTLGSSPLGESRHSRTLAPAREHSLSLTEREGPYE